MDSIRILIALKNENSSSKLRSILNEWGYRVIDEAGDGSEALRKMRVMEPDITILDYELPSLNGAEVARIALEDKICDVLLLVSSHQEGCIGSLKEAPGFSYLTKPLNRQFFIQTLELMMKNKKRVDLLTKEIESLKESLNTRKELDKAKGLLMKHLQLPEDEAFKRIQKQSMDKGVSMKEIARAIIVAYEI